MDQLGLVAFGAILLYRWHVLSHESLATRVVRFIENFGNSDAAKPATSENGVFHVHIRK
jgi:hypothetical protein